MENSANTPPLPRPARQPDAAEAFPAPLKISLSFKNGEVKILERFFTSRISFETPEAERAELYKVFRQFDRDGDGKLSADEIKVSLEKLGVVVSAADLASLIRPQPADDALIGNGPRSGANGYTEHIQSAEDVHVECVGSVEEEECQQAGYLNFPDFCNLYRSLCQDQDEVGLICTPNGNLLDSDLRSAFDLFDKNHDNFISVTELQSVLLSLGFREAKSIDECRSMIASVDSDRDGMVNYSEFKAMMRSYQEAS